MFIERPGVSIEKFKATLCDLPTVVETQKTLDRSTYYKSGDIGQVERPTCHVYCRSPYPGHPRRRHRDC